MIIGHIGRKVKYFSEPSDFPYLHTLAPEAQKELIDSLAEDYVVRKPSLPGFLLSNAMPTRSPHKRLSRKPRSLKVTFGNCSFQILNILI